MSASLAAHILNDAHMSGHYALAGQSFSTTVGYLLEYLLQQEKLSALPPHYRPLIAKLSRFLAITDSLLAQLTDPGTMQPVLDTIMSEIQALQDDDYLLLPGGWSGHNGQSGHSMVYQIKRVGNQLVFSVINAGDGLQYHQAQSSTRHNRFNPVLSWAFPAEVLNQEPLELQCFLGRVLTPLIPCAQKHCLPA